MSYLLLDIGGTRTKVAITEDLESILEVKSFKTPSSFKEGVESIKKMVSTMNVKTPILAVVGGVRGRLTEDHSGILNDGVLNGWIGHSIVGALGKHFNTPVYLENDSALAGLGEAVFGAGKGIENVVYHTISSGVGGIKVVNGKLDESSAVFEPGHQILDIDRTVLGDDITPTLENLVSGLAVEARTGTKPTDIPQEDTIWDELAEYLGQGLRNTILYWSPDVIILGGSMMVGDPKIPIESVRKYTVEVLDNFVECPFITEAILEDNAAIYGGMAYLKAKIT
jgi:predicted NBD/HSP70 family sugar kinase